MARSFPVVLRVQPVKDGQIRGASVHQMRSASTPELNVDTSRTHLNRVLIGSGDVYADVHTMIRSAPRAHSDSTACCEMILSADDDYFDSISPGWRDGNFSPAFEKWVDANIKWLNRTYPGTASAIIHLDEGSPHIHVMIVPIAEYEQSFRRGSKDVRKINYNRIFGDSAQTIRLARDTKNSELTKLGKLQTTYAKAMSDCNLTRGVVNSRAHHRDLHEHGKLVNTPVAMKKIPSVEIIEKTILDAAKSAIGMSNEYDQRLALAVAERDKINKSLLKTLKHHQAKSKEFDTMKEQNINMRDQLVEKDNTISEMSSEISLLKERSTLVRPLPLEEVRIALCYDGSMLNEKGKPRWRNSIDMVKEVSGLEYASAVNWLYEQFGTEKTVIMSQVKAVQSVEDQVVKITSDHESKKSNPDYKLPLTKQEFAIRHEFEKQLDALAADSYRVTLMHTGDKSTYNLGKGKEENGAEHAYTRNELLDIVPELNRKNWQQGYNIFITPDPDIDTGVINPQTKKSIKKPTGDFHYLLVDDLTVDTLSLLKKEGYQPNLTQESSSASIQAVIKLPKDKVDKQVGNALFRQLNQQFGDKNISALSHPFRAVGFRNVKEKHFDAKTERYPIVKLLNQVSEICQRSLTACGHILEATAAVLAGKAQPVDRGRLKARIFALDDHPGDDSADREAKTFYAWCEDRWGASVDWSRADWMLIQRLDKQGLSPELIGSTIRRCSPGLSERHQDLETYISRSVTNNVLSMK